MAAIRWIYFLGGEILITTWILKRAIPACAIVFSAFFGANSLFGSPFQESDEATPAQTVPPVVVPDTPRPNNTRPLVPPLGPQPNEYGEPNPGPGLFDRFREGPGMVPPEGPQPNQYGEPMVLPPLAGGAKKYPLVQVGGVFSANSVWYTQDEQNIKSVGDEPTGTGFRRARLTAFGSVSENIDYRMQVDFAGFGRPSITDLYMDVKEVPLLGRVRIGHFKQPFSLEELTSFRFNPFIDRSSTFLFSPFRRTGVGFYDWDEEEKWTWFFSAFRGANDFYGNDLTDTGGVGGAGRITHCFRYEMDGAEVLHAGASYAIVAPSNNNLNIGRFGSNAPELGLIQGQYGTASFEQNQNMIWAFNMPADYFQYFHLEAAMVKGPLSLQAEGDLVQVTMSNNAKNFNDKNLKSLGTSPIAGGFYVFATYFLTGEHRVYDRNLAVFDRIMPKTNSAKGNPFGGAWEAAIRFNYMTLNSQQISGGKIMTPTFALNWYLNPYTKFSFNYIPVWLEAPNGSQLTNDRNSKQPMHNSRADAFGLQAQVDF